LAALAVAVLLLAACLPPLGTTTARGGGWIDSALGEGRATFGFQLVCDPDTGNVSGQIQYHDHGFDVSFHGEAITIRHGCVDPDAAFRPEGFVGEYRPQPRRLGEGGAVLFLAIDRGEPGPSEDDRIRVELIGGVYDGYVNAGTLQGGNISYQRPRGRSGR